MSRVLARLLLRLYPIAFRRDFGRDALADLLTDLARARQRPLPAALATRFRLLFDFGLHGLMSRADTLGHLVSAHFWSGWGQDVRLGVRSAVRRPAFALFATVSLAVGVGANALVFSVIDTLFLREIPGVDGPDRIVEVGTTRAGSSSMEGWSYPDFLDLREQAPLAASALIDAATVSLAEDLEGERLLAMYVTSGNFEVIGVALAMGRTFTPDGCFDPGTRPVAILSHRTWLDRFGGDPDILGRSLRLNRETHTVVGVAPETFRGHVFASQPALYLPITQHRLARDDPERFFGSRNTTWAAVVGRMEPDGDLDGLNAALTTVFGRLAEEYPLSNKGRGARAAIAGLAPADARAPMSIVFGLIAALTVLVLAATCANVAGMLLARASAREREMAVRVSLGSGRGRLVRHLVTEAMVVFVLGGAAGLVVAVRIIQRIDVNAILPTPFPVDMELAMDWRLGAFGLALTILSGLVFGLLPALRVTRNDLVTALRDGGGSGGLRASRLRRVFVAGQVAVSLLLLATAGLLARSVQVGSEIDPGFEPDGVWVTSIDLAQEGYRDRERALVLIARVLDGLRAMPDVGGATIATDLPLDGGSSSTPVWPDGKVDDEDDGWIQSYYGSVSSEYFRTLGIEVLAGRAFGRDDGPDTERVAMVNRTFADLAWPGESPLGRTVEYGLETHVYTVVGVVADTKADMITDTQSPQVFSFLEQDFATDLHLAVREEGRADDFIARMRATILAEDPVLALSTTRSLGILARLGTLPQRMSASVSSVLGFLALLLSALGLYGVVAFTVTQQTREIGVRIALGARRAQVLRRVLLGGLALALPGIVVGLGLSLALGQVVGAFLLGVSPLDPAAYGVVAAIMLAVILAACFAPARKAASVEPMEALRSE